MKHRDIIVPDVPTLAGTAVGRRRIAVIGIDRYHGWPMLNNAVRDARGALQLFDHLGFEPVAQPLFDDAATGAAIQALVTDDLTALGPDDSLVVFFAGHGGTRSQWLGGEELKTGYLIPVDAAHGEKVATWIDLDDWLRKVARLPPKHILVILDACFAGIALTPAVKWRDSGVFQDASLASLQARRSRRIITSALDDQFALDSGPVPGHSLFTGCLIEGFTHGRLGHGRGVATGTEVGLYLQQRVTSYPESRQTPDFGTFEYDDRGEMVIPLLTEPFEPAAATARPTQTVSLAIATVSTPAGAAGRRDVTTRSRAPWIAAAVAFTAIVLVVSFELVSSFVAEPSMAAESPARAVAPPSSQTAPVSAAAVAVAEPAAPADADLVVVATTAPAAPAAPPAKPRVRPSRASVASAPPASSVPSASEPAAAGSSVQPQGAAAPNALVSTAIAPPPPEPPVAKQRGRANRRQKPAVDERNCPVTGSHEVTFESYPPGATVYLNGEHCGALGKTQLNVKLSAKLPPSDGTATRRFTAIFKRAGARTVTKEFEVLNITRIQRVDDRMPPRQ